MLFWILLWMRRMSPSDRFVLSDMPYANGQHQTKDAHAWQWWHALNCLRGPWRVPFYFCIFYFYLFISYFFFLYKDILLVAVKNIAKIYVLMWSLYSGGEPCSLGKHLLKYDRKSKFKEYKIEVICSLVVQTGLYIQVHTYFLKLLIIIKMRK